MAVGEEAATAEALVSRFQFQKLINQGKRLSNFEVCELG